MPPTLRPLVPGDMDAVVQLSLRAWTPVFASMREVLGDEIDRELNGADWRITQQRAVEDACTSSTISTWVAEHESEIAGFVAVTLDPEHSTGEIYMVAVDPDHQGQGIGAFLTSFALEWIAQSGMAIATVGTGGDPGHAPARRLYEKAGFTLLPHALYFKKL